MAESGELYSTFGSIAISMIDLILHVSVAIWVQVEHRETSQQPFFWLVIVFALAANLISITLYIAKNVGGEPPATGPPQLTELQRKLQDRPEESVVLLMLGLANTEWLCFLTVDEQAHTSFRMMALLSNVIEGVPTLMLQISFLYDQDWSALITLSFMWTIATLVIKVLKAWIIYLTSSCKRPEKLEFFKNLRHVDYVTAAAYLFHFSVILIFLIFTDYAANMPFFGQDWLLLQIRSALGDSLHDAVQNSTLSDEDARNALQTRAGFNVSNVTFWEDVTLERFVRRILLPDPEPQEKDRNLLTSNASALLDEWVDLHSTMSACYSAGVFFFAAGIIFNLGLITVYLRKTSYSTSFVTQRLWRSSLTSSLIATLGLANAGFLNGLTQDERGYSIVRRDSAASHVFWHGIPIIAIASAALAALDCGNRPCGVDMRGGPAEYHCLLCLCLSVPLVWWQLINWMMYLVTKPAPLDENPDVDREALNILEPQVGDRRTVGGIASLVVGVASGILLWLFELLCLLGFYWNTPSLTTPTYLARLGAISGITDELNRSLDWGFDFENGSFQTVLCFWVLGMVLNLAMVAIYLCFWASQTLRRRLHENPALSAITMSFSAMHPEAMCIIADRHMDVCHFRAIAVVPIAVSSFPLAIQFGLAYGDHSDNALLLFTLFLLTIHSLVFGMRGIAVGLAKWHLRPAQKRVNCCGPGDLASLFLGAIQYMLLMCTSVLYLQAYNEGTCCFSDSERNFLFSCFVAIQIFIGLYTVSNWLTAFSFINHFRFSTVNLVNYSYQTAFTLCMCTFDVSWLNLLSQDEVTSREVKRIGMFNSLAFLVPVLLVQFTVSFWSSVDWGAADEREGFLDGTLLTSVSFTFTVFMTLWRILMLAVLRSTRDRFDSSLYFHVLPCFCPNQWQKNRTPPEGWEDSMAAPSLPPQGKAPYEGRELGNDGGNPPEEAEMNEYAKDYYAVTNTTVTNTSASTLEYQDYPEGEYQDGWQSRGDVPLSEMLEAVCLSRALFMTPDGFQGIFIALPTAEDQPVPFLFVQVHEVKPVRKRFGSGRTSQVSFMYNPSDAGGLDVDFIQQNVYNDPEAAWRQLQELDLNQEAPYNGYDDGYSQEQIPEEPAQIEQQSPEPMMTPRTLAAQRL